MSAPNKWSHTQVQIQECNYTWTISNFSYLDRKTGEPLESPYFTMHDDQKPRCNVMLFPMGNKEENKDYLSLFLKLDINDESEFDIHFEMAILNAKGKKYRTLVAKNKFNKKFDDFGFSTYIKRDALEEKKGQLLTGDTLVIQCKVSCFKEIVHSTGVNEVFQRPVEEPFLKKLLVSKQFSDVKLVTPCGGELSAHKIILAACSPVFAAMFNHDMLEREQNVVKIDDVHLDALKEMLKFIYGAKLKCSTAMAIKLLAVADKYEVHGLKYECADLLAMDMTVRNVVEILVLADRHNIDYLKARAMNFIKSHNGPVVQATDFKIITQADLLADIVQTVLHQ